MLFYKRPNNPSQGVDEGTISPYGVTLQNISTHNWAVQENPWNRIQHQKASSNTSASKNTSTKEKDRNPDELA